MASACACWHPFPLPTFSFWPVWDQHFLNKLRQAYLVDGDELRQLRSGVRQRASQHAATTSSKGTSNKQLHHPHYPPLL
eukprot:174201-Chlamydomonas_euryale.AAC.1